MEIKSILVSDQSIIGFFYAFQGYAHKGFWRV